ncbi:McrC family protein [Tepidibacter aestuarii]|uniref:McrC family protein n=1 Tax=Tepidibacter aestuarii TaxID=2925782 RepID=UPI0020C06353|nr:McrC family protein [Tepidibacter aestuarii]CAH2213362.1 5-methylcytosine-specific restriction enzyme subunit McrC [Tepidibacter aestuarii]
MVMSNKKVIELIEYNPTELDKSFLDESTGEYIWKEYSKQINLEFPSRITDNKWRLTCLGWVGYIRINRDLDIILKPKILIKNLFLMWEYAYRLKSFHILDGLIECESILDFYNQLAKVLVKKVVQRGKIGYYKTYEKREDILTYVSGKIDVDYLIRNPIRSNIKCEFYEDTTDNEENQIILWTIYTILKSNLLKEDLKDTIRSVYRSMSNFISLKRVSHYKCSNRRYTSLNHDYKTIHSLCRLFLENIGPTYKIGTTNMLPFIVNMGRIFELFIAEWLKINLPKQLELKYQEKVYVGEKNEMIFHVDLVIYDRKTGKAKCVIDTKYKNTKKPKREDIYQITTYAVSKGCKKAILVYPSELCSVNSLYINDIKIHSLIFNIGENIENSGKEFLEDLLNILEDS